MAGALDSVLGWLRGTPANPPPVMAPPLEEYPTQHDADYARNYGFGDNSVNEDYLNNNKARVLGFNFSSVLDSPVKGSPSREVFVPRSAGGRYLDEIHRDPTLSANVNLNDPKNANLQGQLTNRMMQAALAVNRSPIAAMGFDPSKTIVDSLMKNPTLGGTYAPSTDNIYTTLEPDDSIVHESTHRGFQKLREQYPQAKELMDKLPNEELVVRWLMHSLAGDPEGKTGKADTKQRQQGIDMFGAEKYPTLGSLNRATLDQLQELAIEARKGRSRRSGPQ